MSKNPQTLVSEGVITPGEAQLLNIVAANSSENFDRSLNRIISYFRKGIKDILDEKFSISDLMDILNKDISIARESRIIVKSINPFIDLDNSTGYIPESIISELDGMDGETEVLQSFLSLIKIVQIGRIQSSSKEDIFSDYLEKVGGLRANIESYFHSLMAPHEHMYPIYGAICKDDINDALEKLGSSYGAIALFFSPNHYFDRTTACFGDSTCGGILNSEIMSITDDAFNVTSEDQRLRFNATYLDFYLKKDSIYPLPRPNVFEKHVLSAEDRIKENILLEILKKQGVIKEGVSEYVETQTWEPVLLDDLRIYIDNGKKDLFMRILEHLDIEHKDIAEQLQSLIRSGKIKYY